MREHLTLLVSILPDGAITLISNQMAHIANQRGTLSLVFFTVALWSANSGVAALFDAFNVIYKEKETRSLLVLYGMTFLFTFAWIAFLLAAIGAVIVLPLVFAFIGMSTPTERFLSIVRWPILLMVLIPWLAALYRYGPSRRSAKWRWVTWGSALAAVLWILTSMVFSWYVASFESYNRLYGSLGAGIGFMVWIWLSVVVILIGAELNAEMEHQTARDTTEGVEKPLGMRGAVVADRVGPAQG
jgi:membrane protein